MDELDAVLDADVAEEDRLDLAQDLVDQGIVTPAEILERVRQRADPTP